MSLTEKRISRFLAIVATAFSLVGCNTQRNQSEAFEAIEKGDSIEEVVVALGKPDEIRECGSSLYWGGDHQLIGPNDGNCVEEYYYSSMPGGWSVGFGSSGEVVAKFTYVSP